MSWQFLGDAIEGTGKAATDIVGGAGQIVQGGWNAVGNILEGIGQGASTLVSGFFPANQREKVESEITAPRENQGLTYRPTDQENQSMVQSYNWNLQGWVDTPYEQQYSVTPKIEESTALASQMSGDQQAGVPQNLLADILSSIKWTAKQASELGTVTGEVLSNWGLGGWRTVNEEKPREGYPEGQDLSHFNKVIDKGAKVIDAGLKVGGAFVDQVKGLFNLGYDQNNAQPVFSIQHEIEPEVKIGAVGLIAIILLVIVLLSRKK